MNLYKDGKPLLFSYWEGERPPYIDECFRTMEERSGCDLHIITPENAKEYLDGAGLNERVWELERIPQRADCIRVAVLNKLGGMWCDADTIVIQSFEKLFFGLGFNSFAGIKDEGGIHGFINGYFLCKPQSKFTRSWLHLINERLETMNSIGEISIKFFTFGANMMNQLNWVKDFLILPQKCFMPFDFTNGNGKIFTGETDIREYLTTATMSIALSNSWISSQIPDYRAPVEELAKRPDLFGSIMKFSMEVK